MSCARDPSRSVLKRPQAKKLRMSFFDKVSNYRTPDVIMNSGPLPTSNPPYFPNAKINYNSDLLSGVTPYEYGEPTHLSAQTGYLNVAHRIQKIIPCIQLPNANSEGYFSLSHGVDYGDIAFVLRVDRRSEMLRGTAGMDRLNLGNMIDPFVNLPTVNYLLAGIQRYWNKRDAMNWQQLLVDLSFVEDVYSDRGRFHIGEAIRFITETARPWGVPNTSEMQGGQHEGSNSAVTFPVNFISAFLVDGHVENVCNQWSTLNVSSGDDLVYKLEWLPISARDGSIRYRMNHWSKQTAVQQFKFEEGGVNYGWQLVPGVLSTYAPKENPEGYDYRENGYWHILRSQVMARNEAADDWRYEASNRGIYHDDHVVMRGALLEGTFTPMWVEHFKWRPSKGVKRSSSEEEDVVKAGKGVRFSCSGTWGDPSRSLGLPAGGGLGAEAEIAVTAAEPLVVMADAPLATEPPIAKLAGPKKVRRIGLALGTNSDATVVVESLK